MKRGTVKRAKEKKFKGIVTDFERRPAIDLAKKRKKKVFQSLSFLQNPAEVALNIHIHPTEHEIKWVFPFSLVYWQIKVIFDRYVFHICDIKHSWRPSLTSSPHRAAFASS